MMGMDRKRIVEVGWPSENGMMFVAGIKVSGDDRPAMLSDIHSCDFNFYEHKYPQRES